MGGRTGHYPSLRRIVFFHRMLIASLVSCPMLSTIGCDGLSSGLPKITDATAKSAGLLAKRDQSSPNSQAGILRFTHDFKQIGTDETVSHNFSITNPTKSLWTFGEFHSSCQCTAGVASSKVIQPGETETVQITYRSGVRSKNDTKSVLATFLEPSAPQIALEVHALVRRTLTVQPDAVQLGRVNPGFDFQKQLEVENYGQQDWDGISVQGLPAWIKFDAVPIDSKADSRTTGDARQRWRLALEGRLPADAKGKIAEMFTISANGMSHVREHVIEIVGRVTDAVSATPSQFFFGKVGSSNPVSRKVVLLLAEGLTDAEDTDLRFVHDLGEQLELQGKQLSSTAWQLTGTLKLGDAPQGGVLKGTVKVMHPRQSDPLASIPVYAKQTN